MTMTAATMSTTSTGRPRSALGAQEGVLTTAQAVGLHGRGHLRAQLVARRWQRPTRGVIVLHNGPLTDMQLARTALLCCPAGSALAGLSALTIDGLEGFEARTGRRQVALPEGATRPSSPLVVPTGRRSSALATYTR